MMNNVDKSNIKYYDVVIKWLNIITLRANMCKRHTKYHDVVIKWLNITTLRVNMYKRHALHYNVVAKWLNIVTLTVAIDLKLYFIITLPCYLLLYQMIITCNVIITILYNVLVSVINTFIIIITQ